MQIESIGIKNYKVFRNTVIKGLPKMYVFLGANGSGKTTLFDVSVFLNDALQNNVTVAINRRGGFNELISRGCSENDKIEFEIKFRSPPVNDSQPPLVTYFLEIGYENGKAIVEREILKYRRGQYGQPWKFMDFKRGEGTVISNEEEYGKKDVKDEREYQKLSSPDILALKELGQCEKYRVISSFRILLENWYVSNFKIDYGRTVSETGILTARTDLKMYLTSSIINQKSKITYASLE
jgi:predicted ATPase